MLLTLKKEYAFREYGSCITYFLQCFVNTFVFILHCAACAYHQQGADTHHLPIKGSLHNLKALVMFVNYKT